MPLSRKATPAVLSLVALVGCGLARPDSPDGPRIVLRDSAVLVEPDSVLLGRFAYIAAGENGSLFLADLAGGRVLRYSPKGALELVIGGLGSGPGELLAAGQPGLIDDSILAVPDPRSSAMSLFNAGDGRFLARYRVPFADVGQSWTRLGDTVVFGVQFSPGLLGRFVAPTGEARVFGTLPESVRLLGPTFFRYGRIEVVSAAGGWLAQVPAEPGLSRLDVDGTIRGRVDVPVRRRRGIPPDLVQRHQSEHGRGTFRHLGSMAAGLWRMASGPTAMVTLDVDPAPTGEPINPRYYVSVISPRLDAACVDGRLPFESDSPLPMPYMIGDTVITLVRRIDGDKLRTIVFRYLVDTEGCDWAPISEESPEGDANNVTPEQVLGTGSERAAAIASYVHP